MIGSRQGSARLPSRLAWILMIAMVGGGPVNAEVEAPLDPSALLRDINSRYEALMPVPRRAVMEMRTVLRQNGQPDVKTRSRSLIQQQGRRVRYETYPEGFTVDAPAGGRAKDGYGGGYKGQGGSLLWVHDGRVLRTRYVTPSMDEGEPAVREFSVDHALIPADFGSRFTDPMGAPELPDEFLAAAWTARPAVLHGKKVILLRSEDAIALSPVAAMEVALWLDPVTGLVRRMESTAHQNDPTTGIVAQVSAAMDIRYELNVTLDEKIFELELGPGSEDLTEQTVDQLRRKLIWRGETAK